MQHLTMRFRYQTETALIVSGDIAKLTVYSLSGSVVAQSEMSQVVKINHLNQGVYVVHITDKEGRQVTQKFIKK